MTWLDRTMEFFKRRPSRTEIALQRLDAASDRLNANSDVLDKAVSRYSEANDPFAVLVADLYLREQLAHVTDAQRAVVNRGLSP